MESYVKQHLPEAIPEPKPEVQNQLKEPEEMNEPLPVRNLDLNYSKTKRNLFGISGGHIRSVRGRIYSKF